MMNNEEWIEQFWIEMERLGLSRPQDYKERALRILKGTRKPIKNQFEGKTGRTYYE